MAYMTDESIRKERTIFAITSIIFGCTFLFNMPREFSVPHNVDFESWQPWAGASLLTLGISLIVLFRLWDQSKSN
jgi:hypothetical protein